MPDVKDVKKVVLAYSGGLDTSVILRWLIEKYRCEVVAFCADLGQGEELIPVRDKARRTGAGTVHIVDLRETFVKDFLFPMLRGAAVYEGSYLLGTSIARPLIAQAQVDVARKENADAVAHATAEIEFEAGTPVAVDGPRLGPVALLERVNRIGAEHGIGRVALVENRFVA